MITELQITGFKCHSNLRLQLSNITLLVGTNSSGKSSIIQALLLIAHNITNPNSSPLNGHLVSIGSFTEARNFVTNAKTILFSISSMTESTSFSLEEGDTNYDVIKKFSANSELINSQLNYSNNKLHYLSAHRQGNLDLHIRNNDKYDLFGIYGEFVMDYFQHHKNETLSENLIKSAVSNTLEAQVNFWLNKILNHSLKTEIIDGTDKIKAEFNHGLDRSIRSKNTGSGVSYLISIIISCLSSKTGDLIIIENPEIHLHPLAQSLLTEFFIFVSLAGIQLLIETHSDHIFNGVRVQINNKIILPENVSINFFDMDYSTHLSRHSKIIIDRDGRINNQKDFLFDQFDNDINSLLGI